MKNQKKVPYFFQALPSYCGGKRKLVSWIFKHLNEVLPREQWQKSSFLDLFSGGGALSLAAKAYGFRELHCNDWSARSQLVFHGLLANTHVLLTESDLACLLQPVESPGFVYEALSEAVFSKRHARLLDNLSQNRTLFSCPTKQAMASLLIWHLALHFVGFSQTFGSSNRPLAAVADNMAPWWELNPKRLSDKTLGRLLQPITPLLEKLRQKLNRGVLPASGKIDIYREDVFSLPERIQADVLYLDPPYAGTLN